MRILTKVKKKVSNVEEILMLSRGWGCAEAGAQRGMTKGFNVNDSSPPSLAPRNERVKEIRGSAKI